ncbi:50S ribosomal protein L22 [Rickettsiales endosymbiont of Stachyamoeba lipophora]|uniref:50S ribosomal protein L22 n=1 Tax=Rickettsiales endosymbiont of Stachyamoeba lipophora TaxID=2486578 RepID=UPI000F64A119|nr:50S ribosomal protein L22 [Rickettsiales endosymbiont of Stachyamoeba lipophora]AZL15869.1 50S ribosomal protein L22 [Rickettsiales endosymbiont of Stachyamoeba lipophora]
MTDTLRLSKAKLGVVRTSPIKLNNVAKLIRGLKADAALLQLKFCKKRISTEVRKCLLSAIANAENNHGMNIDDLYIDRIEVGKSILMKRFRARARGKGAKIEKFFSNITILLKERKA